MKNLVIKGFILAAILPISALAQLDPATIQKIRTEGLEKSQVMDIAFNLTDKSGNRLANSEGYARAANYAKEVLTKMVHQMQPSNHGVNLVKDGI